MVRSLVYQPVLQHQACQSPEPAARGGFIGSPVPTACQSRASRVPSASAWGGGAPIHVFRGGASSRPTRAAHRGRQGGRGKVPRLGGRAPAPRPAPINNKGG